MTQRVGIIGLGAMGGAMARRLAETGLPPLGFDLKPPFDLATTASAEALCAACDLVIFSLPHEVATAAAGAAFIAHAPKGAILVDTSTVSPEASRALAAKVVASGRHMLDAPVSGGPAGARAGTMAMMVGGDVEVLERARQILARLTARIVHVGPSGAGSVAKLVNNHLVGAHLLAAAQALRMGRLAGVDAPALLAAINGASGRSAATEVNFPRWILSDTFDSGFTAGLMRKDLRLAAAMAGAPQHVLEAWLASAVPDAADFNRVPAVTFEAAIMAQDDPA
jgi:3-hydroxyisobutyrate dehydrogenase